MLADFVFSWYALPVLLVGVMMAGLGVVVLARERGSNVSLAFCFLAFSAAVWLLGIAAIYSSASEPIARRWVTVEHLGVILIPSSICIFSLAAVQRFRQFRYWAWAGLIVSVLLYLVLVLTDQFVTGLRQYPWGYYPQYGPLSIPFLVFFAVSMATSLRLYWIGYRNSPPGPQRFRLKAFLIAFGVGYLGTVDFLPTYGVSMYPFGYVPVLVFLALSARAIQRYRLFDISPAFAARHIIKIMPDALLVLDRDGVARIVNPAACQLLGRTQADILGRPITTISSQFFTPQQTVKLLGNGDIYTYEIDLPKQQGENRALSVSASLVWDQEKHPAAVIYLTRDITERKRAEERIGRLNAELEQKVLERTRQLEAVNQELEAFSFSVSHDLRAPLRSIDGFSQALLEDYSDKLDAEGRDYLERVRAATQRMGQLIDDLLTLSRVTRGELRREPVDLSALASTIAGELQRGEPERRVQFVVRPGLSVQGDPHLLSVALENLLENAWKFTSKHRCACIEVGADGEDGKLIYFVRDDGAGFDEAYAQKLFRPFQRLHDMTEFPGTGIGLATVQRIIQRHGGQVWARGAEAQGATFYFTL